MTITYKITKAELIDQGGNKMIRVNAEYDLGGETREITPIEANPEVYGTVEALQALVESKVTEAAAVKRADALVADLQGIINKPISLPK